MSQNVDIIDNIIYNRTSQLIQFWERNVPKSFCSLDKRYGIAIGFCHSGNMIDVYNTMITK